jgi:hypothetical protein
MFLSDDTLNELKVLDALAEAIGGVFPITESELQPTSRACKLAALAALSVLNAHELGQEVADGPAPARPARNGRKPKVTAAKSGACDYCGRKFLARGLKRHMKSCPKRPDA